MFVFVKTENDISRKRQYNILLYFNSAKQGTIFHFSHLKYLFTYVSLNYHSHGGLILEIGIYIH